MLCRKIPRSRRCVQASGRRPLPSASNRAPARWPRSPARLTDAEWQTRLPKDGRKIGVVVHHVATMYPLEIQLAQTLAEGKPIDGVTVGRRATRSTPAHAKEYDAVTKEEALDLLRRNSTAAAAAIRALSDEELDAGRAGVALLRCAAHVPVPARGSRRAAQLSPPRHHREGVETITCGTQRSTLTVRAFRAWCHPGASCRLRGPQLRPVGPTFVSSAAAF